MPRLVPPPPADATAAPVWAWLPLPRGAQAEPAARAWLATRLGGAPEGLPLQRDRHGRPQLGAPFEGWDCNWSHSGAGLLVALGAGMALGVDLEWVRPRPRAAELARRFFTPNEAARIGAVAGEQRTAAFVRLWCAKEAVLKAHGRGLAFGLDRLAFAGAAGGLALVRCDPALGAPGDWRLRELAPAPGYVATLAWRPGPRGDARAAAGDNARP